jgi:hypothetical protein
VTAVTVAAVVAEMAAQDMAPGSPLIVVLGAYAAGVLLLCGAGALASAVLDLFRR